MLNEILKELKQMQFIVGKSHWELVKSSMIYRTLCKNLYKSQY